MDSRGAPLHGGYWAALLAPFRYVAYLTLLLALLLLAAWAIDAFLVFKVWPDGVEPLKRALTTAGAAEGNYYGMSFFRTQGVAWGQGLYHALFVASAIEGIVLADPRQLTSLDQTVQRFFVSLLPALQVAMLATKLYGFRLAMWLSAVLPLMLGYTTGMIDGLVERSIRRHSGGRESANLYHRGKYAITCIIGLWLFGYVCLPLAIDLKNGSLVTAAMVGALSRMQWKYYKKYV